MAQADECRQQTPIQCNCLTSCGCPLQSLAMLQLA